MAAKREADEATICRRIESGETTMQIYNFHRAEMTPKSATHSSGFAPELTVAGQIATITLRRPEMAHRLEPEDLSTLRGFIRDVDARRDVLVLRLCAEGRHFCAGFNIGSIGDGNAGASSRRSPTSWQGARGR